MAANSAILYQNPSRSIILMDIPRSISLAQSPRGQPAPRQLYSTPPPQQPYPSLEPKSVKAWKHVAEHGMTEQVVFPTPILQAALEEIAAHNGQKWCEERRIRQSESDATGGQPTKESRGRKLSNQKKSLQEPILTHPSSQNWKALDPLILSSPPSPSSSPLPTCTLPVISLMDRLVQNPLSNTAYSITIDNNPQQTYLIPPGSSFFLSEINPLTVNSFSMAAFTQLYTQTANAAGPGQFDLILLDPPWPNRSARRSKAYKIATTADADEEDPFAALLPMLGQHIAPNGIIACWITNSASVRESVSDAFTAWEVQLVEEWAWLKVTADGRPVSDINGVWRKPYEILLIGRKTTGNQIVDRRDLLPLQHPDFPQGRPPMQRVIVAVPDVHSRKPHLKELIESLVMGEEMAEGGYRALEVFGRNLTAGWWTWGDEVLRFNWKDWWTPIS